MLVTEKDRACKFRLKYFLIQIFKFTYVKSLVRDKMTKKD